MNTKSFSAVELLDRNLQDPQFVDMLMGTSSSEADAYSRIKAYSEVMENQDNILDTVKAFSGYSEMPLLANQQVNATMASYVRSIAGYITMERSMDQPTALLWYNDVLGVTDNRKVLPNIGPDNLDGLNSRFQTRSSFTVGQKEYTISTNKKLIPGSVEMKFIHAADGKFVTIKDDRNGNLLAPAGVLEANASGEPSVNYLTGLINFTVGNGFVIAANDSYTVLGFEDVAGDPVFGQLTGPGNNRVKLENKNYMATAEPDILVAETDLMTAAAARKSIGYDVAEVAGARLTELYTKLINQKIVRELITHAQGDTEVIPMNEYVNRFTDFNSRLDAFQSNLVNVDTNFAKATYKATKATAYVVGDKVGNYFMKLSNTGAWVDNKESTYVNDLLGHYKGIPVIRHLEVEPTKGYAVHKTPGGELAPVMRGIFLPLTKTPRVGNYNKPVQMAEAVYYQECNNCIVPELIQQFEIKE